MVWSHPHSEDLVVAIHRKGHFFGFGGDKELISVLHDHPIGFGSRFLGENDYLQRAGDWVL